MSASVGQVHLTFGDDAARSMVVSWSGRGSAREAGTVRVRPSAGPGSWREVSAVTRSYTDAAAHRTVVIHHAVLDGLEPATHYDYEVGTSGAGGTFSTAPSGRAPFAFTSFADQGTPVPGDPLGTPSSGYVIDAVERIGPLFTFVSGDLSYANARRDRIGAWRDWFDAIEPSARQRPWMPAAGNHENEGGNGPLGFDAYQARFLLPDNGEDAERGLWYSFTVAGVRFIVLNNDDVCYQDGGDSYVRGYSRGRQKAWLERTLKQARADPGIDWIVVSMHQVAVSTSQRHNGADLGIREEWLPLFDAWGVDLVVCGHEHHYERTHPLRGVVPGSPTLTPRPVATRTDVVDTSAGTVHMVLGSGGTTSPSAGELFDPPACRVITGVVEGDGRWAQRSVYVVEDAPWSAYQARDHPYAFATFEVDPGEPGGTTSMRVTVRDTSGPQAVPFDTFTLVRPRS